VEALARQGVRTGASTRNWESCADAVDLPEGFEPWRRDLLTDPQTSGGLLIAVAAHQAEAVLNMVRSAGFASTAAVGRLSPGEPRIRVIVRS
jgi:selenide,water dikinase